MSTSVLAQSEYDYENINADNIDEQDFSDLNLDVEQLNNEALEAASEDQSRQYLEREGGFINNPSAKEKILLSKLPKYQNVDIDSFFEPKGPEDSDVPVKFGEDSITVGEVTVQLEDGAEVTMNSDGLLQFQDAELTQGKFEISNGKLIIKEQSEVVVGDSEGDVAVFVTKGTMTYDPDKDVPGTNEIVMDSAAGIAIVNHDDDTILNIGVPEGGMPIEVNGVTLDKGTLVSKGFGDYDVGAGSILDIKGTKITTEKDMELRSPQSLTQQILEALQSGDTSQFSKSVMVYGPDYINIFPKDNNIELERTISTQHGIINNYPANLFVNDINDDSTVKFTQNYNRGGDGDDSGVMEISSVTFSNSVFSPTYKNRAWLFGLDIETKVIDSLGNEHSSITTPDSMKFCSSCELLGTCTDNAFEVTSGPNEGKYLLNKKRTETYPPPPDKTLFEIYVYEGVDTDKELVEVWYPINTEDFFVNQKNTEFTEGLKSTIMTAEQYYSIKALEDAIVTFGVYHKESKEDAKYFDDSTPTGGILSQKEAAANFINFIIEDLEPSDYYIQGEIDPTDLEQSASDASESFEQNSQSQESRMTEEAETISESSFELPAPDVNEFPPQNDDGGWNYWVLDGLYINNDGTWIKKEPVRAGEECLLPLSNILKIGYNPSTHQTDAFGRSVVFKENWVYVRNYN